MSRRNLSFLQLGSNILFKTIPKKYITINIADKFKIRIIYSTHKIFLAPKSINYSNYIFKRNLSKEKSCEPTNTNKEERKKDYNRHSYNEKVEKLVNEQINVEYEAAYAYLSMALFYGRSNVALPGCHGFFMKMYYEELQHALDFAKYQLLRGGVVSLKPINPPELVDYSNVPDSFNQALELEKQVKETLQQLMKVSSDVGDTDVENMLDTFIANQEKSIYELARLLTRVCELSRSEIGKYLFDRELHETHVKEDPGDCKADVGPKLYT